MGVVSLRIYGLICTCQNFDKSSSILFALISKVSRLLLSIYMDNHFLDMIAVLFDG